MRIKSLFILSHSHTYTLTNVQIKRNKPWLTRQMQLYTYWKFLRQKSCQIAHLETHFFNNNTQILNLLCIYYTLDIRIFSSKGFNFNFKKFKDKSIFSIYICFCTCAVSPDLSIWHFSLSQKDLFWVHQPKLKSNWNFLWFITYGFLVPYFLLSIIIEKNQTSPVY
jgi:hypothetical protein